MNDKERFADMIRKSKRIVAFTGAGISTESGIPDFRSAGGLFDRLSGRHFSGEETLSIGFLETYPELFFRNYAEHFDFSQALPNAGHRFFAGLSRQAKKSPSSPRTSTICTSPPAAAQSSNCTATGRDGGRSTQPNPPMPPKSAWTRKASSAIPKAGWCVPISSSTARCSTRRRWSARLRQSAPRTCLSSSAPRWPSIRPRASSIISKARTPSY
jgi:hypothetical protein